MKAAKIIHHKKPLEIQTVSDPKPGPEDAVIKIEACGVCRSDWHAWQGDWSWIGLSPELPITPGHEFGGIVEEVGKDVKSFRPGDRVTVPFHSACGRDVNTAKKGCRIYAKIFKFMDWCLDLKADMRNIF